MTNFVRVASLSDAEGITTLILAGQPLFGGKVVAGLSWIHNVGRGIYLDCGLACRMQRGISAVRTIFEDGFVLNLKIKIQP
jgi:hypothetical protein